MLLNCGGVACYKWFSLSVLGPTRYPALSVSSLVVRSFVRRTSRCISNATRGPIMSSVVATVLANYQRLTEPLSLSDNLRSSSNRVVSMASSSRGPLAHYGWGRLVKREGAGRPCGIQTVIQWQRVTKSTENRPGRRRGWPSPRAVVPTNFQWLVYTGSYGQRPLIAAYPSHVEKP